MGVRFISTMDVFTICSTQFFTWCNHSWIYWEHGILHHAHYIAWYLFILCNHSIEFSPRRTFTRFNTHLKWICTTQQLMDRSFWNGRLDIKMGSRSRSYGSFTFQLIVNKDPMTMIHCISQGIPHHWNANHKSFSSQLYICGISIETTKTFQYITYIQRTPLLLWYKVA